MLFRSVSQSRYPGTVELVNNGQMNFLAIIGILVIVVATVGAIIYVELGERILSCSTSL